MNSPNQRRVHIRAEMAELLWEVAPPESSVRVKKLLADIQILALLTLTLSASMFIYSVHSPVILAASMVGMTFSVILLALERLSLSHNVARVRRIFGKLPTSRKP